MLNLIELKNKNILITGASLGIGRECAILSSKLGANVILIGRNKLRLKNVMKLLEPGKHICYSQDITEFDKLEGIISDAVCKIGKISGFVHSAGIEKTLPFKDTRYEIFKELFDINVFAGFEIARILSLKKYLESNESSFVFIASTMGIVGKPGLVGYCGTKGAILSSCRALALELARKGIRVNSISPSIVETEMIKDTFKKLPEESVQNIKKLHPLGFGTPRDVANVCVFLLSNASGWITGSNIIVDGGFSIS